MITKSISLAPPYEKAGLNSEGLSPTLTCIIHDSQPERKYPALIAIPGGSYEHCSKREGEPCAARWYSYGYNGFVLDYSSSKAVPHGFAGAVRCGGIYKKPCR